MMITLYCMLGKRFVCGADLPGNLFAFKSYVTAADIHVVLCEYKHHPVHWLFLSPHSLLVSEFFLVLYFFLYYSLLMLTRKIPAKMYLCDDKVVF